jgi:hypothetical protein
MAARFASPVLSARRFISRDLQEKIENVCRVSPPFGDYLARREHSSSIMVGPSMTQWLRQRASESRIGTRGKASMRANSDKKEPGFLVFENDAHSMLLAVVADAVISTGRAVSTIDLHQPETLKAYDDLTSKAEVRSTHVLEVALREELNLTPPVAAIVVMGMLTHWSQQIPEGTRDWLDVLEMLCPDARPRGTYDARVVYHAIHSARSVAHVKSLDTPDEGALRESAQSLEALADIVTERDPRDAVACLQSARNLIRLIDLKDTERLTGRAIEKARSVGNADLVVAELALRCDILMRIAEHDSSRERDTFDAVEEAIRAMLGAEVRPPTALKILTACVVAGAFLRPLQAMLTLVLSEQERRALPFLNMRTDEETEEVRRTILELPTVLSPIWSGTTKDWLAKMDLVRAWSIPLENHRLTLEAPTRRPNALVDWASWSFTHPNLVRAVPHMESLLREEHFEEILLVLHHEIAHVFSLLGFLGTALFAMRIAQHQFEIDLWGRLAKMRADARLEKAEVDVEAMQQADYLAPLTEPDTLLLAQAEQALEVERKIEMFQNCWTPWFEGVAVFGETAADPRMDAEAMAPAIQVVFNLWDTPVSHQAEEAGISITEAFQKRLEQAENMYAKALRGNNGDGHAYFRLRQYLDADADHYLIGYLAVRAIIAAWRTTLGRPASGAELFATLLHVTRFSDGAGAVPDLSLPVDQFREAVCKQCAAWVMSLARISRADLEAVANSWRDRKSRKVVGWEEGRLLIHTLDETSMEQTALEKVRALARQALNSLRGAHADTHRLREADAVQNEILNLVAKALTHKSDEPMFADRDFVSRLLSGAWVLPLGQADCPFWLLPESNSLATLIRSRERDKNHGNPSYAVTIFNLDEKSFAELRREVERSGRSRLRVTRVADLYEGDDSPSLGRNFVTFQLGDWLHVRNGGAFFGAVSMPDGLSERVRSRLAPSRLLASHQWLTGDGHPAAKRTLAWIRANDWNVDLEGIPVDVSPWAHRVAQLAERVLSDDGKEDFELSAASLMQALFGSSDAAQRIRTTFAKMRQERRGDFRELIRILEVTGYRPERDQPAAEMLELFFREQGTPLLEQHSSGWDVVCPQSLFTGVN